MMQIKNIILDLGGVLLNLNYHLTIQAFQKLGDEDFQRLYTQAQQTPLFDDFEKGLISSEEFIGNLATYLPENVTSEQIIEAWNAMLLDFPMERFDFLRELKSNYRLVLLSNTNTIHLDWFHNYLRETYNLDSLEDYFDKVYYSCELKAKKPDVETFLKVCELENFEPSETLFVDDSIQHVEGAKKAGIQAFYLDVEKEGVMELLGRVL